jgi:glutamate-1-semialdehyde aminotransferase
MEPMRNDDPAAGFLEGVRQLCDDHGAVMVFDEITAGWRFALGGAHLNFGVEPDVAVFAKAIGNGHPMAAIIGRREVMQAAEETFISSTYWTEGVGPAAALATIHKMQSVDVPGHLERIGGRLRDGMTDIAEKHSLPLEVGGRNALLHFSLDHADDLALQTLFTIEMLERGILAGAGFYGSYAHRDEHVDTYLAAADEVFPVLRKAIEAGDAVQRLDGQVRHTGFRRLT